MNRTKRHELKLRVRRQKLRRQRHELRSLPKEIRWLLNEPESVRETLEMLEAESEEPPLRLPSPYAMERTLRDLIDVMKAHEFSSVEEANAILNARLLNSSPAKMHDDPEREAQELAYQAKESNSPRRALQLAKRALELDPDCVDALDTMAYLTARSEHALVAMLGNAVETGERSLGSEFFEDNRGHFWSIVETRPYMRTRFDLACELLKAGRRAEAAGHFEALLELNPNDNQGVRDFLLACYFSMEDLAAARDLLDRYEGDGSAIFLWGNALERYLSRDFEQADRRLEEAREGNPYAQAYLTGRKTLPRRRLEHYRHGADSEAVYCATLLAGAWQMHPEAICWAESSSERTAARGEDDRRSVP